jgi:hypothetical protein
MLPAGAPQAVARAGKRHAPAAEGTGVGAQALSLPAGDQKVSINLYCSITLLSLTRRNPDQVEQQVKSSHKTQAECADLDQLYIGSSRNPDKRGSQHLAGRGCPALKGQTGAHIFTIWTLQDLAPGTLEAISKHACTGVVDMFLRSAEQAAIETIMEQEHLVCLLNQTDQTFGWSPFSLEASRGGRHLTASISVMEPWSPEDHVLGLLRRSLGINADPEDIKDLNPAMVAAYNETSYAKVRE